MPSKYRLFMLFDEITKRVATGRHGNEFIWYTRLDRVVELANERLTRQNCGLLWLPYSQARRLSKLN